MTQGIRRSTDGCVRGVAGQQHASFKLFKPCPGSSQFGISNLVSSHVTHKSEIKTGILSGRQYNRNINSL